jgi:hypothetical protein
MEIQVPCSNDALAKVRILRRECPSASLQILRIEPSSVPNEFIDLLLTLEQRTEADPMREQNGFAAPQPVPLEFADRGCGF